MTETGEERMNGTRRRRIVVVLIVLLLLLGGVFLLTSTFASDSDPYDVTSGAHYNATNGPEIALQEDLENTTVEQPFPDSHTVDLHPYAWIESAGPTEAEIAGLDSEWTTLTNMSVASHEMNVSMSNKQDIQVRGDTETLKFRDMAVDDGSVDFRYGGPDGGTTTIVIHDLPADSIIVAWDSTSGERLDYNTSTSNGALTLHLPQSDHDVELQSPNDPAFVDSTAEPTGPQNKTPDELAVNVTHEDFPDTNVTVDFYLNGDNIGGDHLTDEGRASISENITTPAGDNEWYAVAEDDYGNSNTTSSTYDFTTPDTIYIYNETDATQLVDEVNVEIQFYIGGDEDEVITRNTTDGTVDMTGLPIDQQFVVVAEADGYHPRRIYITSLAESEQIYLLPVDTEYVDLTFEIEDFTGSYPQDETILAIERVINGSWQTVQGDFFGATGQFTAQLKYNVRHRLTLINAETGDQRRIGTLTPTTSGVQTIEVTADDEIQLEETGPRVAVDPSVRSLPSISTASTTITVDELSSSVDEWSVNVTYENNSVTETLYDESFSTSGGTVSPSLDLLGRSGGTVYVDVSVVKADGTTMSTTVRFSVREHFGNEYSLIETLSRSVDLIPERNQDGVTTFVSVLLTIAVAGGVANRLGASTEAVGAVGVATTAGFSLLGWVSMELVFALGVTFITLWAVRRGL